MLLLSLALSELLLNQLLTAINVFGTRRASGKANVVRRKRMYTEEVFSVRGQQALDSGRQLELLHRISGIVSSSLMLEKMLEELVALVVSVTVCDACLVYLVDELESEIVLCASQLPHAKEIGKIRMKIGEGVTGWVAQHRSVVA